MSAAAKVLRYQLADLARSRWLVGYGLLCFLVTESLLRLGGAGPRAVLSLMQVVLLLVPLVALVFGTMYLYHAREFIELLLAQPLGRRSLFAGLYGGLALALGGGFLVGVGLPLLWHGGEGLARPLATLLAAGLLETLIFLGIACVVATGVEDRSRGLGLAVLIWLVATLLFDGLLLFVVARFGDYPIEPAVLVLTVLNPVDLARVLLLLVFDAAALMGYTGAVFARFFGGTAGVVVAVGALLAWVALPAVWGLRRFVRKDF